MGARDAAAVYKHIYKMPIINISYTIKRRPSCAEMEITACWLTALLRSRHVLPGSVGVRVNKCGQCVQQARKRSTCDTNPRPPHSEPIYLTSQLNI